MTKRIFHAILFVSLVVLSITLIFITGLLYEHFGQQQDRWLKQELKVLATGVESQGLDYLEKSSSDPYRLTWIDATGQVLFDSLADRGQMTNHLEREEIQEALKTGQGRSLRYSKTLLRKTQYEALRLPDGTVLRLSASQVTVTALLLGLLQPILALVVCALLLSYFLARRMTQRIVKPLNELDLDHFLEQATPGYAEQLLQAHPEGNSEESVPLTVVDERQPVVGSVQDGRKKEHASSKGSETPLYEELSPFLRRLIHQQEQLRRQTRLLQRKQHEWDQITYYLQDGLLLLQESGLLIAANPAACRLFQIDDSALGKPFSWIQRDEAVQQAIQDALLNGKSSLRQEIQGRTYQLDFSRIEPESEKSGSGLALLVYDVTEALEAEANRRQLTANVSHELKTPLQAIMGSSELLMNGMVNPGDQITFYQEIHQQACRLLALIQDLLHLSQLDEGGQWQMEPVDVFEIAQEVQRTLQTSAEQKGIQMEISGESTPWITSQHLLYDILYNLCDNAIRYGREQGWVKTTVEKRGDNLRVVVEDNGIGIGSEDQGKIFQRFYRVDKSRSSQSGGTGLGLAIVKHSAEVLKGTLTLSSRLGDGTRVEILFPKLEETGTEGVSSLV